MTPARYAVVDLATGKVLDVADDEDDALERLDDELFAADDEDDNASRDVAVVDLAADELVELDNGHVVRHWLDGFSGVWRRRLA